MLDNFYTIRSDLFENFLFLLAKNFELSLCVFTLLTFFKLLKVIDKGDRCVKDIINI